MDRNRKENCGVSKMSCLKSDARLSLIFLLVSAFWIITVDAGRDTTRPKFTINKAAGQVDPAKAGPINLRVIFSESVSSFTASNVPLGGTSGAGKIVTGNRIGFSQIVQLIEGWDNED